MSPLEDSELGIGPDSTRQEREALVALAERLERQRPIPAPGFRGRLRRSLLAADGVRASSPRKLRALVATYAGSGFALLAIAALGVGGVGPLAGG